MRDYNLYPAFAKEARRPTEEHKKVGGKWVPTPGEGGPGSPEHRRSMVGKQPHEIARDPKNQKRLDALNRQYDAFLGRGIARSEMDRIADEIRGLSLPPARPGRRDPGARPGGFRRSPRRPL